MILGSYPVLSSGVLTLLHLFGCHKKKARDLKESTRQGVLATQTNTILLRKLLTTDVGMIWKRSHIWML